jgi:hypothetical protein
MIKKLKNQPYAPKSEQAPKVEQREEKNRRDGILQQFVAVICQKLLL